MRRSSTILTSCSAKTCQPRSGWNRSQQPCRLWRNDRSLMAGGRGEQRLPLADRKCSRLDTLRPHQYKPIMAHKSQANARSRLRVEFSCLTLPIQLLSAIWIESQNETARPTSMVVVHRRQDLNCTHLASSAFATLKDHPDPIDRCEPNRTDGLKKALATEGG